MQINYDKVASFYDPLARIVFGKSIVQAQQFFIKAIPVQSKILIVGGGTGWILNEIAQQHKAGLHITYVELSQKMINLSQKRYTGANEIIFLNEPVQQANLNIVYDVIITPFLFDNFAPATILMVFEKLHRHLRKDGLWLFADFQVVRNNWWQKLLLRVMYLFFRLFCNIETTQLPSMHLLFQQYQYKAIRAKTFYKEFITSVVYTKEV